MLDDSASAGSYDDPMSGRILGIAADVLRSFGSAFGGKHLAIVGGAVPGLLVSELPAGISPHVGTADLDLHLSLHLLEGETADYYQAIIDGLRSLGLAPETRDGRVTKWRWLGRYRETRLQVELLCPVRRTAGRPEAPAVDTPAEKNVGPTGEITALAVGWGHVVPLDTVVVQRRVDTIDGHLLYDFPVAGLTSWLCLKTDAIMRRSKAKDAYDVVWTVDALGPEAVAVAIASSPLLDSDLRSEVVQQLGRLIVDQFLDIGSVDPSSYARFLRADPSDRERRHGYGSIQALGRALRTVGVDVGLKVV